MKKSEFTIEIDYWMHNELKDYLESYNPKIISKEEILKLENSFNS